MRVRPWHRLQEPHPRPTRRGGRVGEVGPTGRTRGRMPSWKAPRDGSATTVKQLAFLERWPSGRRRAPAKGVYGLKPVSRVRIPPSPPVQIKKGTLFGSPFLSAVADG